MRACLIASVAWLAVPAPASAQYNPHQEQRTLGQRIAPADGIYARDWREYGRYDVDRPEPGQPSYDADRYYRDARYYRPHAMSPDDRLYRGRSGRFYCRRADGTTGRVEALDGGAFNGLLAKGRAARVGELRRTGENATFDRLAGGRDLVCR